jgi:hypothetical protein
MAVSTWFREEIKSLVRKRYQSRGGYLDGMFTQGESSAGTVKFPVGGGRIDMYKLTGAIQRINPSQYILDLVTLVTDDYEASMYFRMQDEARMGPSLKAKLADDLMTAIRRKKDTLKLDALRAFIAAGATTLTDAPTAINTIGDGSARIDVLDAMNAISYINGTGSDAEAWWAIPDIWMTQLCMYKEINDSDYAGPKDLPFASASKSRARTINGVHMFSIPDEYFTDGTGAYDKSRLASQPSVFDDAGYLNTYMWTQDSVGSETWWDQENMSIDPLPEMEGTPYICKVQLSSAAIGILPEGVKQIRMKAIESAIRPT